ncbi:MAG TPA: M23 family metallopeptidase [Bryobacteraceae bacterium]|nr:M23 family metallopeptidase [Bryobacteraceae bacterium]
MTRGGSAGVFSMGYASGALSVALLLAMAGAPEKTPPAVTAGKPGEPSLPQIALPLAGLRPSDIRDTFEQGRSGGRPHEAADIMAPRGTPVYAVDSGVVKKLFTSRAGGLTVYQFDSQQVYCYYYAHLDRYATGIAEGKALGRGDVIGYVGSTGNADPAAPHLHFGITRIGPEKRWWGGEPINPYPILIQALKK